MKLSNFFIDRPIFAAVLSAFITIGGATSSLSFTAQVGSTNVPVQTISVTSTSDATPYTASVPPNVGWISIGSPSPATASALQPSVFFVAVLPANLTAGVYTTNITIHPTNGSPDVIVPVTATISVGSLSLSTTTLNFTQVAGAAAPAPQTVNVTNTGTTPLTFNAFAAGATWLTVTQSAGATPATLTVSVNAGSLQPGNYTGTINVVSSAAGNSPQVINVNLVVAPPQNLVLQPATLNFTSQFGSPAPPPQTVALGASTGSLPFTVAVNLPAGQTWLSVTPTSGTAGTTVTNLTVSANPANLQAGTYTGSLTITSAQASNSPQTVSVTYIVTPIPTPVPLEILNAGSLVPGGIAPGEIITIKGNNVGPVVGVAATFDSAGFYPTILSDTRVLFDGIPGPLHYVQAGQINVIVPYAVAGRSQVNMVVQYKNTPSSSISLRVADSAPGIFPYAPSGPTAAAALNWNGTINSPANPASREPGQNAFVIYATGEGLTSPPGVDGLRTPLDGTGLKSPLLPVTVTVGGRRCETFYVGSAPGFVAGAFQVNAFLPDDAPTGNAVPVVITVGTNSSQGLATIAIR